MYHTYNIDYTTPNTRTKRVVTLYDQNFPQLYPLGICFDYLNFVHVQILNKKHCITSGYILTENTTGWVNTELFYDF